MHLRQVRIGTSHIDFERLIIEGEAGRISIEPKVLDVLRVLYAHKGSVVSREELIDQVWGLARGSDEGLTRAISLLRKALGDKGRRSGHIETISKRGYRLKDLDQNVPIEKKKVENAKPQAIGSPPPHAIAILPFLNLTPERQQDFFIDGITEEIISVLAQVSVLRVTGRTSSFAYKGSDTDIVDIAATLNVKYVLTGSMRKQGDRVRITAKLIQADNGFHLWSKSYDEILGDALIIQDNIAASILMALSDILKFPAQHCITTRLTDNREAYALFLQGRQLAHLQNGQTTLPTAIHLLERAVALDPDMTEAWSWLALSHSVITEFSKTKDWRYHFRKARETVEHCLALSPSAHMAWHTLGNISLREFQFDKAVECFEKAHSIAPNDPETMIGLAYVYSAIGLHERARPFVTSAITQDPLCAIWHALLAGIELMSGNLQATESAMYRGYELGYGPCLLTLALLIEERDGPAKAVDFLKANFSGLGPNEQKELNTPIKRKLFYDAFYFRKPFASWLVSKQLKHRCMDRKTQPTGSSIMGFYFMDKPELFMRVTLKKPNPYIGYVVARVFENTKRGERLRTHPDFPAFAEQVGLVKAWKRYGWPEQICRDWFADLAEKNHVSSLSPSDALM